MAFFIPSIQFLFGLPRAILFWHPLQCCFGQYKLEIRDKKCKHHLLRHPQASVLYARCIFDVLSPYAKMTFQMQMYVFTPECRGPKKSLLPMQDEVAKHGSAPASFSSLSEFTMELRFLNIFPPVYYSKNYGFCKTPLLVATPVTHHSCQTKLSTLLQSLEPLAGSETQKCSFYQQFKAS
jgi:hypothetical protein